MLLAALLPYAGFSGELDATSMAGRGDGTKEEDGDAAVALIEGFTGEEGSGRGRATAAAVLSKTKDALDKP